MSANFYSKSSLKEVLQDVGSSKLKSDLAAKFSPAVGKSASPFQVGVETEAALGIRKKAVHCATGRSLTGA